MVNAAGTVLDEAETVMEVGKAAAPHSPAAAATLTSRPPAAAVATCHCAAIRPENEGSVMMNCHKAYAHQLIFVCSYEVIGKFIKLH